MTLRCYRDGCGATFTADSDKPVLARLDASVRAGWCVRFNERGCLTSAIFCPAHRAEAEPLQEGIN